MKVVSGRHFCRVLERHGWVLERIQGSHHIYGKPANQTILTVPVHGNRDLKRGTLRRLMKDAGLAEDDLRHPAASALHLRVLKVVEEQL